MPQNPLVSADTMNAPWGLESRFKLVVCACKFFGIGELAENCARTGKQPPAAGDPKPRTVRDFLKHLEVIGAFTKTPNAFRVVEILDKLASVGALILAERGDRAFGGLDDRYVYGPLESDIRRDWFRFVPVIGAEFLYYLCAPGLVHITGTKECGASVAGTGLVVDPSHVLTCRHVVGDMVVDKDQTFQDQTCVVDEGSIYKHPEVDVAVIRVEGAPLTPLKGALFLAPVVAQTVYTLGYPKLPGLRDASVTMQQGAVTNESVTSLAGESLFLYSAISRPGNSGGPVMSDDGYVVGLSIVDATGEYFGNKAFSPHYAGIPAQVVGEAVESLGLGIELPFEKYE